MSLIQELRSNNKIKSGMVNIQLSQNSGSIKMNRLMKHKFQSILLNKKYV